VHRAARQDGVVERRVGKPPACVKRRYPNQGVALKALRGIQDLKLPHNKQQRAYWCEDGCGAWHLTSQPLREQVDLTDAAAADNLRELKVFETPDVARAAALVAIAVQDVGGSVAINSLAAHWQRRYPRHDVATAKRPLRVRLLRALRALNAVGVLVLAPDDNGVTVVDIDGLHMVASNLDIFEDRNGLARKPSRWPRNPMVPAHLRDVQASLIAAGVVGWKRVGKGVGPPAPDHESVRDHAAAVQPGRLRRLWHWLRTRLWPGRSGRGGAQPTRSASETTIPSGPRT
jgi:hypothetical protein